MIVPNKAVISQGEDYSLMVVGEEVTLITGNVRVFLWNKALDIKQEGTCSESNVNTIEATFTKDMTAQLPIGNVCLEIRVIGSDSKEKVYFKEDYGTIRKSVSNA